MTPVDSQAQEAIDAERALEYIRNFAAAWAKARPSSRAIMLQSARQTVTVRGEKFVSVRVTVNACAHGFAIPLPREVQDPQPPGPGRPWKSWAW